VICIGAQPGIFFTDGNRFAAPAGHLVDATDNHRHVLRSGYKQHRVIGADGRQRPVLEFRREHALAVGIGDFFQFQCAFQGNGIGQTVAQAVQIIPARQQRLNRLHLTLNCLNGLLHQIGQGGQWGGIFPGQFGRQIQEGNHLIGKSLGRRHTDFVAAGQRQGALADARQG